MLIHKKIFNVDLIFKTDPTLFSPSKIDKGTLAMISVSEIKPEDKVLDLGCGYGIVGIYAAKIIGHQNVVMADIDPIAISMSKENEKLNDLKGIRIINSDGYEKITENDFSIIFINPPYHADFSIPKTFIEKGYYKLRPGGRMFLVTKRKEWYKRKLISVFGGVNIHFIDGYYVFMSEKKKKWALLK